LLDQVDKEIRDAQTIEEEEEEVGFYNMFTICFKRAVKEFTRYFRFHHPLQLFSQEQHIMSCQHFT